MANCLSLPVAEYYSYIFVKLKVALLLNTWFNTSMWSFLFTLSLQMQGPVRIAVIENYFNKDTLKKVKMCDKGYFDLSSGEGNTDHSTNVLGLITEHLGNINYCIYAIAVGAPGGMDIAKGLEKLIDIKVDVINISAGGTGYDKTEFKHIKKLLDKNVHIAAAAGNDGTDLTKNCNFYPACYDERIYVIGNLNKSSNKGTQVDFILNGVNRTGFGITQTGTSQATAIFSGLLVRKISGK